MIVIISAETSISSFVTLECLQKVAGTHHKKFFIFTISLSKWHQLDLGELECTKVYKKFQYLGEIIFILVLSKQLISYPINSTQKLKNDTVKSVEL